MRIKGAGKRGREGMVEVTRDEKVAMIKHQLAILVDRVPSSTDKMLLEVHRNILARMELLVNVDNSYINNQISTMSEPLLEGIKVFYSSATVGEQTAWKLSRYFLKEVRDLEHATEMMQRLADVLHKAFELVIAKCMFSSGRFNYREIKAAVEKQLGVIKVLREHGRMQDTDLTS